MASTDDKRKVEGKGFDHYKSKKIWAVGDRRWDFYSLVVILVEGCCSNMGYLTFMNDERVNEIEYLRNINKNYGTP